MLSRAFCTLHPYTLHQQPCWSGELRGPEGKQPGTRRPSSHRRAVPAGSRDLLGRAPYLCKIQIQMQTRLPKAVQSLDLLLFLNPRWTTAQGDSEFSLSASPWCHGNRWSEDHHCCRSLLIMLHRGWMDQKRGKGHGLSCSRGKGQANSTNSLWIYTFPGKPPDLPIKAFPTGERQTAVSLLPSDHQPEKPTRMHANLSLAAHTGRDNSGLNYYDF